MKKFLQACLVFGLLLFVVDKGLYFFIEHAPKKEYDKRLELILNGEMNKDIIILGSSRGANNIAAEQLEKQTGLSTYNLSYRGSNVIFHEFILKTLLKYNKKPEKLLLVIDYENQFLSNHSLHFRYDRLFPLKNYSYINQKLIASDKKNVLSPYLFALKIDRADFNLKPNRVYPINLMTSHGSKLLPPKPNDDLKYIASTSAYDINKEDEEKLASLHSIERICKENNIQLYYVFTPIYKAYNTDFVNRFKNLKSKRASIIFYDTLNTEYRSSDLFRDEAHMFSKGAQIFTSEIAEQIDR
ncbi:hypothetical protein [Nonlabens xiamenensis]|uniref:hypothetical protein n=1 Tax=Nonlabens xiamenensis TaxID=2341043 RepID=UPI000F60F6F2|nr:hypothetical protein [Nonlabens xiamenensis]